MPTPAEIINRVASLQNDTAQTRYTDDACLPYLNMALDELQEIFAENNIPVTNQVISPIITIPAGVTTVGYETVPALPEDLIEIYRIWETTSGQNGWVPIGRADFVPADLTGIQTAYFGVWAWVGNELQFPAATGDLDIKLEYIRSIFPTQIEMEDIDTDLGVRFKSIKSYLSFATAALCSMFIGENETRAAALNGLAQTALERSLNIPTKGRQSQITRRRPFRASYKMRGVR